MLEWIGGAGTVGWLAGAGKLRWTGWGRYAGMDRLGHVCWGG